MADLREYTFTAEESRRFYEGDKEMLEKVRELAREIDPAVSVKILDAEGRIIAHSQPCGPHHRVTDMPGLERIRKKEDG